MAQQKSEDRVVPDGGVMPVQPGAGGGGQGEGGPGRANGGAAPTADRDSRRPWWFSLVRWPGTGPG